MAPHNKGVTFKGFATEPSLPPSSLYEFQVAPDTWIRLHDTTCTAVHYHPGGPPSLVLLFVFDDPEWTPEGVPAGAVIRLTFAEAVVQAWTNDGTGPDDEGIPGGQVSDLSWDNRHTFTLMLLSNTIQFTAACVTVDMPAA
ncbi:MAG: hypothetical protein M3424_01885 [Actinomycetota bacterium]|nr:hypothetical protein [Actinomycetota bacterium]